ncbi:MAG: TraR/DksA family transcriptional regulator [Bdellovibrionia bacterium]
MSIHGLSEEVVRECRFKLIELKQDLLNRVRHAQNEFVSHEKTGDEVDLTVAQLEEHHFLINQARLRHMLLEIESALSRIEQGTFGICEETEEPIEPDRLLTIPWTRLSIEGAEIREAMNRRYAR